MKILVVDDHPLIREALKRVLPDLQAEVELFDAADCASALQVAASEQDLDLVLLDLELPDLGGLEVLRRVRECCPATPVVVLSGHDDAQNVVGALDGGAMGFVPKSCSHQVMLSALRLVLSGGVYVPPQALVSGQTGGFERRAAAPRSGETHPEDLGLTERQAEVLALMVQGKPNKLICRELKLAEGTVKIHVTAILKALNVQNRTQAVIEANRLGLCLPPTRKAGGV